MSAHYEIERKFLVEIPDIGRLDLKRQLHIRQTYLKKGENGSQRRVRSIKEDDELNQAAIEAKKNAPKREKTCYFERAKMKRDAARLGKKPKTTKDQTKGRSKKQEIE